MNSTKRIAATVAGLAGALFLAGCAKDAPQDTWQPQGKNAQTIQDVQWWPFLAAGVVGVLVFILIGVTVWKHRDRGQPVPKQTHGNLVVELGSLVFSAGLLASVAVVSVGAIFKLADTGDCKMVVNVTGQQWWWEYSYPPQEVNGVKIETPIATANELVMPTGTCVMLRVTSRDVIHSYWIPALNGKKDAVPNRTHLLKLETDRPGIYDGQCTEFCGLSHANMKMSAVALDPASFGKWVAMQQESPAPPAPAQQGETASKERADYEAFGQCVKCHQINGRTGADGSPEIARPEDNLVSGQAPNLTHLMSRTTFAGGMFDLLTDDCRTALRAKSGTPEFSAAYLQGVTPDCLNEVALKEWIRNPTAVKPMDAKDDGHNRGMPDLNVNEETITKIVDYLKTTSPSAGK